MDYQEREKLNEILPEMDIVFLSALVPGKIAPVLVTEDMVKNETWFSDYRYFY